jgi:hypothetical protein
LSFWRICGGARFDFFFPERREGELARRKEENESQQPNEASYLFRREPHEGKGVLEAGQIKQGADRHV